ncbi:MAG TPA: multiheme c-type cytochrome, partial [Isosphaeraceae bacterium]|nr:multiheme c-type cytochrome [Isosphaeraceae bacterium]
MTEEAPRPSREDGVPGQEAGARGRRVRAALSVALIAAMALAALWLRWPRARRVSRSHATTRSPGTTSTTPSHAPHQAGSQTPDPEARSGLAYVGSAACAHCHAEISRSYARHPMGRSLRPLGEAIASGEAPFRDQPTFEAGGFSYAIEHRDGRIDHVEIRRDAQGAEVVRNQAEARYVIGSGRRAFSFLVERGDGYLFESPITWYAQERTWDLSPGFERNSPHFERPIRPACLFCHANQADIVAGTENHYRPPIFRGHAIGCERCHG